MATLTTKYSIGDRVYFAGTTMETKCHPCPDCNGTRKWKALSPAGGEYEFGCPRCNASYHARDELRLEYPAHAPAVRPLTVGSIQYNTAPGSWGEGASYMCSETGVGSGTVYYESKLFPTEQEALKAAEVACVVADSTAEHIVARFNRTLEISDYQLDNAALKVAKDTETRARSLLYNISDLFATIDDAADKEAILEAVAEYKDWSWKRDLKEAAASADRSGEADETATQIAGSAEGESAVPKADAQGEQP